MFHDAPNDRKLDHTISDATKTCSEAANHAQAFSLLLFRSWKQETFAAFHDAPNKCERDQFSFRGERSPVAMRSAGKGTPPHSSGPAGRSSVHDLPQADRKRTSSPPARCAREEAERSGRWAAVDFRRAANRAGTGWPGCLPPFPIAQERNEEGAIALGFPPLRVGQGRIKEGCRARVYFLPCATRRG